MTHPEDYMTKEQKSIIGVLTDLIGTGDLKLLPQGAEACYKYLYKGEEVKVLFKDVHDFLMRVYKMETGTK